MYICVYIYIYMVDQESCHCKSVRKGCIYLTCKAADGRQLARFGHELATTYDDGTAHARWRIGCTWGVMKYFEVIMQGGKWLTAEECEAVRASTYTALFNYLALRSEAVQQGHFAMWRPKPKLHMIVHLVEDFILPTHLNPRSVWCYGGEDFVGKMKKLAKACHRNSVVLGLIHRYLLQRSIDLADYRDTL